MNSTSNSFGNTPSNTSNKDHLMQEISAVASETEALMKHAADTAGEQTDLMKAGIEKRFHELQDRFHTLRETMGKQARATVRATDEYVHEHPWQSVGTVAAVSLVAGVLIGTWLRRS